MLHEYNSCNTKLIFLIGYVLFFSIVLRPATGLSAEFIELSNVALHSDKLKSGQCTHIMRGEIVPGDSRKLSELIDRIPKQNHDELNFLFCLDSEGGNLREGLKIGALFRSNFFGTFVPENARCLSACAIAFMHGTIGEWEYIQTFRMLHPLGRLGFHAPSLGIELDGTQNVPFAFVEAAHSATLQDIADIVSGSAYPVSSFAYPIIPTSLIAQMLKTEPDQFFYIDDLHKSFLWGIYIYPHNLTAPDGFDLDLAYYQLCENISYILEPHSYSAENYARTVTESLIESVKNHWTTPLPQNHKLVEVTNTWNRECSYTYRKDVELFTVRRYEAGDFTDEVQVSPVFLFPPRTKIVQIAPK
ncbi:MAG: hypothetical protein RDA78_09300 [Roseibium sp.]|uniref:hypothetical protein n=1 Tax=Roseibium sp. TaxID=1936156 RepID=UPI003D9C0301